MKLLSHERKLLAHYMEQTLVERHRIYLAASMNVGTNAALLCAYRDMEKYL